MFPAGSSNFENDLYANVPNMSMMYAMYTTTFGNQSFVVQPPMPGKVGSGFPTVPYLGIEALFYQQQSSNPMVAPNNLLTGQTIGQQGAGALQTMNDQFGTNRYMQGYQQGTGNL